MSFVFLQRLRQHRWFVIFTGLVGICLVVSFFLVRTPYYRILTVGTDSYKTHHPLYGERRQSQVVQLRHDIGGVGVLAVGLRKKQQLVPVEIWVFDGQKKELARGTINPTALNDDQVAWTSLSTVIPQSVGPIVIELSASQASVTNPIGIRFDQYRDNHLAIGLIEQVSLAQQWRYWQKDHPNAAKRLRWGLTGGVFLAVAYWLMKLVGLVLPGVWLWRLSLVGLAVVSLYLRWPLAQRVESIFGGDAYNYILKSYAWIGGEDVFAADIRKGPLFSFLLLPGLLTSDPVWWGRMVSMVAATIAVILTSLVVERLTGRRALAIAAGLLLTVERDFLWESVHGLANITYAALLVAVALAFFYRHRCHGQYWTAVLAGLATLTRYEGGLVTATLLPAMWLQQRRWRTVFYTLVPVTVLTLIPFILWPLTGNIGVRPPADIAADGGLSVAYSFEDFQLNLKSFRQFFGRAWVLTLGLGSQRTFFLTGLMVMFGWQWLQRFFRRRGWRWADPFGQLIPLGLIFYVIGLLGWDNGEVLKHVSLFLTALTGAGMAVAIYRWPGYAIPIGIMVSLQIMVVTAILPKPRYYIQLIPFMTMAIVLALYGLQARQKSRWNQWLILFFLGFITTFIYIDGQDALGGMVSDYNSKSHHNTVMRRAAKRLQPESGVVAAATDDLSLRVYLTDKRLARYVGQPSPTLAEQLAWLKEKQVTYVVEDNDNPLFSVIDAKPTLFTEVETFTLRNSHVQARVYRFLVGQ